MLYRHKTSKAVVEAPAGSEHDKSPDWDRIDPASEPPEPAPDPGVQQPPLTLPDLDGLDKPALLEIVDRERLDVNRRLGTDRLREAMRTANPLPAERDLAPGT